MGLSPAGNETMLWVLFYVNANNLDSMASFQWGERMS